MIAPVPWGASSAVRVGQRARYYVPFRNPKPSPIAQLMEREHWWYVDGPYGHRVECGWLHTSRVRRQLRRKRPACTTDNYDESHHDETTNRDRLPLLKALGPPPPRKDSMRLYIFWISTIMAASLDDEVHQQCYIEHLLTRVLCGGPHASNVVRGIVTTGCC